MVRHQANNPRRRPDVFQPDGGRRFDDYLHDEQHPNPLETAARLRREKKERYKRVCSTWIWVEIPLFLVLLATLWMAFSYHQMLHHKNECEMSYIYRPLIFLPIHVRGNTIAKYSLMRYHEGYTDENIFKIDIPVLFVPGSSGSGKQVRSLATTLMNRTAAMGMKFKSRFVLFACDFDEEFSFLSGATLIRQREFVVKSIETIMQKYSPTGVKKLLLFGHSFGGTILHSLPAHPRVDLKWMDLVITLGAPINGPPFMADHYMEMFYEKTIKAWDDRETELSHVTLVSFSGGIKDFMVPDHLARSPFKYTKDMEVIAGSRDTRVLFRPSWSLSDVRCPVDHNCLAWCNQLVKHISSMVIDYGMEWKWPNDGRMKASRQVVKDFYSNRIGAERRKPASKEIPPLFNNSIYIQQEERRVKMTAQFPYVTIDLDLKQYDLVVYIRSKAVNCPIDTKAIHADLTFRSAENFTSYSIQDGEWMYLRIMPSFPETHRLKGTLRIGGTPGCEYEVESRYEVIGTVYRRLMDSTTLPFVVFYTLFFLAIIPVMRQNRLPPPFDYIYADLPHYFYTVMYLMGSVLAAFVTVACRFTVERNLATYLIWAMGARLATLIITRPGQPIVRQISRFVEWCPPLVRLTSRFLLAMTTLFIGYFNINLGYAFILFLNLFKVGGHSKNGMCLIIFSISILISIGLAGNVRDGPAGIFQRSIYELNPKGYMEALSNIFYDHPHPLLFSFITSSFSFLLNFTQILQQIDASTKEKIVGVLYSLLTIAIIRVTNLESMAIATSYYIFFFETLKDYKELKAGDGKEID
ncbi:hypothetical protein PENTCL1PPCAC_2306 [Pristionchus entomophagus]|uniref:GPI inositol-deacylase n=1 Tax=Pristionchus entomophagus TaxID=358040 RepID=A0AAV5SA98_9BILA|nr:hypothetical protein PENTCL1PPCAC_2306 [Pristionchus entomophagus]